MRNSAQKAKPVSSSNVNAAEAATYQTSSGEGASPPAPPDFTTGSANASPVTTFDQQPDVNEGHPESDQQNHADQDDDNDVGSDSAEAEMLPCREIGAARIKAESRVHRHLKLREGDPEPPALNNTITLVTMFEVAKARYFGAQHLAEKKDIEAALAAVGSDDFDEHHVNVVAVAIRCWRLFGYDKSVKPKRGDHDHGFDRLWHSKNKSERISDLIQFLKKIDAELEECGFSVGKRDVIPLLRTLFTAHELSNLGVECDDWTAKDSAKVLAKCFENDPAFTSWDSLHRFPWKGATTLATNEMLKALSLNCDASSNGTIGTDSMGLDEQGETGEPNTTAASSDDCPATSQASGEGRQTADAKLIEDVWYAWLAIRQNPPTQRDYPTPRRGFVPPPPQMLALMRTALEEAQRYTQEHPDEPPAQNPSPYVLDVVRRMVAGVI